MNSLIENRDKYNNLCLKIFTKFLKEHPELRFIQALWALDVITREDKFFEESEATYFRMKEITEGSKNNAD